MQYDDALIPYVVIGYNKDSPSREHIAIIDTNVPELRGLMQEFTCRFREHVSVFVHSLRNALDKYKDGFAAYLLTRDVFEGEVDIKLPSHLLAFSLRAYPIVPFVAFDDYVSFNSYNDDGTDYYTWYDTSTYTSDSTDTRTIDFDSADDLVIYVPGMPSVTQCPKCNVFVPTERGFFKIGKEVWCIYDLQDAIKHGDFIFLISEHPSYLESTVLGQGGEDVKEKEKEGESIQVH